MEFEIIERSAHTIAHLIQLDKPISSVQDAVDVLGNASYQGAVAVIIEEKDLAPDFFDLKTRLAGDILQKYANYQMKLAIVGDFEKYNSNALNAFIVECNRGKHIFFVPDFDSALEHITR